VFWQLEVQGAVSLARTSDFTDARGMRFWNFAFGLLLPLNVGCERVPADVERPQAQRATPKETVTASPVASATATATSVAPAVGDAKVPFEFPQVAATGAAGDYVLAPPRSWIDAALEKGADKQTFIYYGGWLKKPADGASVVETLTKHLQVIPNSLIIVLPKGRKAKLGDLVLTSWASGTGMQRAIVVEGGSDTSPNVRYLDMSLDHPTGWGERVDRLPENTFATLDQRGDIGTTAACKEGNKWMRYIITARAGKRLLGYGFAGKIAAFSEDDCKLLSLKPVLTKGDWVSLPVVGRYTKARVRQLRPELGRVWAKYRVDGDDRVGAFALLDTATRLD
jgi:hypothetical protein